MRISDWSSDVCSSDLRTCWNPRHGKVKQLLRVLLTVLLPLAAPFLVYFAWLWLIRRQPAGGPPAIDWRAAPWPWLLGAGLVCALARFLYITLTTGPPAGPRQVPPRVVHGAVVHQREHGGGGRR